jgi:hypothetical protein
MIEREGDMFNARHILLKPDVLNSDPRELSEPAGQHANAIRKDSSLLKRSYQVFAGCGIHA